MYQGLFYIPLALAGIAAVIWGLPAAHRLRPPFDVAAALAVLLGVIAAIIGTLLIFIPNFFRS